MQPVAAQLELSLFDFEGKKLWSQQQQIEVAALKSQSYLTIPIATLLAGKDARGVVLFSELLVGGKAVSSNEHFFGAYKNLSLPRPQITSEVVAMRGGFKISLSTDKFARAVCTWRRPTTLDSLRTTTSI
mgnify:CR=1 FL=1